MVPLRSNLARFVPVEPLDADEIERKAARAWRECSLGLVRPSEIPSEWLRRGIEAFLDAKYGRRNVSRESGGAR